MSAFAVTLLMAGSECCLLRAEGKAICLILPISAEAAKWPLSVLVVARSEKLVVIADGRRYSARMSKKLARLTTLCCLLSFSCGCSRDDDSPGDATIIAPYTLTIADNVDGPYVECDEDGAEFVLEVFVTVPKALDRHVFRIPSCRIDNYKGDSFPSGPSYFCAAGPNGGLSGSVGIESSTEASLSVRIGLLWTKHGVAGELEEHIEIPVGTNGAKSLADSRSIEWRFESPKRAKTAEPSP
jgi:hypothetical protein